MATTKEIFLFGIAFLISGSLVGASNGLGARRSLLQQAGAGIPGGGGVTTFDVTKFGAVADGKTENAGSFMQTWIAACKNSTTPSKLLIPRGTFLAGQISFSGPCTSPKPIIVEVEGTVKATTDLSDYLGTDEQMDQVWIAFEDVDGLVLNGNGVFDGQGGSVWGPGAGCTKKTKCRLPSSLKFTRVNNAIVTDVSSVDSKMFHFHLYKCNNFSATHLKITAPGNSPNTDGMHISGSDLVTVTDSVIGTGDDCISVGQGCTRIAVNNITCGPGHGISVGSLGKRPEEKSVDGVTVTNCRLINTTNGARIKTWIGTVPGEAKNIIFENLTMTDVQNPIIIDQSYGSSSERQPSNSVWKISDAHFRKITGTTTSNVAVSLQCSTRNPCQVELANVDLTYSGRKRNTTFVSSCANAMATLGGILNPPACPSSYI